MAGSVATEHHFWLNLTEISEKEEVFLRRKGLPIQGPSLRPGLGAENIHEMHGCYTGPFEPPGHSCVELPGRLAHSGSLQGANESSQKYCSTPHPFSWPQDERQEECTPPISANPVSGGSFGFHSDAGPFGSCPDIQFYSMSGPLQARPACLCRFMPQAARPHGSDLPCVASRVASHEAVLLVDKGAEATPHCTSHSPYQGVAWLLSTPFTMAGPCFSSERSKNRCDSPSPYGHDGRINDGLGSGLRRQTGERGMDRRVPLLAHKLPGTQGCLPGFDVFSPRPRGASYHSQDGQHGGCVPHKPSGSFTVAHPGQACAPSSPWSQYKFLSLRAVHVPGILNLAADFLSRQKLRPGEWMLNHQTVSQIWDLFGKAEVDLFASQESSQCPLWFSERVLPVPEPPLLGSYILPSGVSLSHGV